MSDLGEMDRDPGERLSIPEVGGVLVDLAGGDVSPVIQWLTKAFALGSTTTSWEGHRLIAT